MNDGMVLLPQHHDPPQKETKRACNLNRSFSDRARSKETPVVFHDTMALRQKKRADCRIDFSDLEKLDGITSKTRKLSNAGQNQMYNMLYLVLSPKNKG
nr:unnamed protein product [Callosobruchus chinensis]